MSASPPHKLLPILVVANVPLGLAGFAGVTTGDGSKSSRFEGASCRESNSIVADEVSSQPSQLEEYEETKLSAPVHVEQLALPSNFEAVSASSTAQVYTRVV